MKGITLFTIISLITFFSSLSYAYSENKPNAYSEKVFNKNECLNNETINSWKKLANCAVNPRPIGRGYKALKNEVFY